MKTFAALALVLCLSGSAHAANGFELIPSIGLGKPSGEGSSMFDPALGFALSAGARLGPSFSLAGQLGYQMMSIDNAPPEVSMSMIRLQMLPAFHFVQDTVDVSIGPTLGLFFLEASNSSAQLEATARGFELGVAVWVLFAVSPQVSLGPTLSYARLWASEACQKSGSVEMCDDSPDNDEEAFWTVMFALRF